MFLLNFKFLIFYKNYKVHSVWTYGTIWTVNTDQNKVETDIFTKIFIENIENLKIINSIKIGGSPNTLSFCAVL